MQMQAQPTEFRRVLIARIIEQDAFPSPPPFLATIPMQASSAGFFAATVLSASALLLYKSWDKRQQSVEDVAESASITADGQMRRAGNAATGVAGALRGVVRCARASHRVMCSHGGARGYSTDGFRRYRRCMVSVPPHARDSWGHAVKVPPPTDATPAAAEAGAGEAGDSDSAHAGNGRRLTVATLNVLAGKLGLPRHFPFAAPSSIAWPHRRHTLLRNITDLEADILCLQELDNYWVFFKPQLAKLGYDSVYLKRPSVHKSSWSGVHKADGCGVFYKQTLWQPVAVEATNYLDVHDRVALLTLLKSIPDAADNRMVLVITTHLYWNRQKLATQLAQLRQLDRAARRLIDRCAASSDIKLDPASLAVVVCGDFNNVPGSPVYEYMTHYFLSHHGTVAAAAAAAADREAGGDGTVVPSPSHSSSVGPMASAYRQYQAATTGAQLADPLTGEGEPTFTTVSHRRCDTIDYIWHNRALEVTGLLSEPPLELMACDDPVPSQRGGAAEGDMIAEAIPNKLFGSDHIPIMAQLRTTGIRPPTPSATATMVGGSSGTSRSGTPLDDNT